MPVTITQRCPACGQLKRREEFPTLNLPRQRGKRQHTHGRFCNDCVKKDPLIASKFDREPTVRELER